MLARLNDTMFLESHRLGQGSICGSIGDKNTSARFSYYVGRTPQAYVTHHRMSLAGLLVGGTGASVSHIGFALGYRSGAAFINAFRRFHGRSPALWRRSARGQKIL